MDFKEKVRILSAKIEELTPEEQEIRRELEKQAQANKEIYKKIYPGFKWVIGCFLCLAIFGIVENGISSFFMAIIGLLIIPPISDKIREFTQIPFYKTSKAIVIFILFLLTAVTTPTTTQMYTNAQVNLYKNPEASETVKTLKPLTAVQVYFSKTKNGFHKTDSDNWIKTSDIISKDSKKYSEILAEQNKKERIKKEQVEKKAAEIKKALDGIIVDYSMRELFSDFYIHYATWNTLSYKQKEDLIKICANYRMHLTGESFKKALTSSRIKDYSNNKVIGEYSAFGFNLK